MLDQPSLLEPGPVTTWRDGSPAPWQESTHRYARACSCGSSVGGSATGGGLADEVAREHLEGWLEEHAGEGHEVRGR